MCYKVSFANPFLRSKIHRNISIFVTKMGTDERISGSFFVYGEFSSFVELIDEIIKYEKLFL